MQFQCAGVLSKEIPCYSQPQVMTDFFEGVFDEHIIKNKLDDILHLMFDQAQDNCSKFEEIIDKSEENKSEQWFTLQSKKD